MGLKPAIALCLALVASLASANEQRLVGKPELLPASTYVGAEMYAPRIAPNGRRLLFLRDADAATEVVVLNLETSKGSVVATVRHGKHVLNSCDWASDDRLVCSTMWSLGLKANRKSHEGYSFRSNTRLFAIDRDGGNFLELVPPPNELPTFPEVGKKIGGVIDHHHPRDERKHDILSLLPDDPDHVLVEMVRGYLFSVGVWKLNIRNNTLDPVVPPIGFARYWSADHRGRVRIGTGTNPDPSALWGTRRIYVEDGSGGFRTVEAAQTPQFGSPWLLPKMLGYTDDGASAYVEAHDGDSGRLVVLQVDSRTLAVQRRIAAFESRDAAAVPVQGTHCGVMGFAHEAVGTFTWLDYKFGEVIGKLDRKVPGYIRAVPSLSADCSRLVVIAEGDGRTPMAYLHDRATGRTSDLGTRNPALDGHLAETADVYFQSEDGYPIIATLTRSRQRLSSPSPPSPLVVLLDVGPLGMAEGYNPWAEFLASRGYTVLAPRVRGLGGFGDEHLAAGLRMWGQRMRDDMAAGVRWATSQGLAAPEQVCYVGRGRGGYMALAGAQDNDVGVRCAAAFGFEEIGEGHLYDDRTARFNWYWRHWIGRHWQGDDGVTFRTGINPLRGEDAGRLASASVSPLIDAPHPGIPVLLDAGTRMKFFNIGTRRYQNALATIGSARHALPQGTDREVAFLNKLETLLKREIGGGG